MTIKLSNIQNPGSFDSSGGKAKLIISVKIVPSFMLPPKNTEESAYRCQLENTLTNAARRYFNDPNNLERFMGEIFPYIKK